MFGKLEKKYCDNGLLTMKYCEMTVRIIIAEDFLSASVGGRHATDYAICFINKLAVITVLTKKVKMLPVRGGRGEGFSLFVCQDYVFIGDIHSFPFILSPKFSRLQFLIK